MKRTISILTFLFITASIFYQGSKVYAFDFSGLYIAPKINYFPESMPGRVWNHYAGAGVAVGYDLFRLKNPFPIPLRVELEYLGKVLTTNTDFTMHSVMAGIYYELNLFHIRASELDTLTTKSVYSTKRPFMAVYLGMKIGAKIGHELTDSYTGGSILTNMGTTRTTILFGVGAGLAWHVTSWFTLDLGYMAILGPGFRFGNDVLLSFRFTKP